MKIRLQPATVRAVVSQGTIEPVEPGRVTGQAWRGREEPIGFVPGRMKFMGGDG
jgi:hypothetical protein